MADDSASSPPTAAAAARTDVAHLAQILELISDGVYVLDRAWRFVIFNRAAEAFFGRAREELLGRSLWDVFPPGGDVRFQQACRDAMADLASTTFEVAPSLKPGRVVEIRIAPLGDVGIAVALSDVTERRRAEDELRAARDRGDEILESISEAFYAVDRDWRLTYVNHVSEVWAGRSRDQLIGKILWEVFPQVVGSATYEAHMKAAAERRPVRVESYSEVIGRWVDMSIYPNEHGQSVYFRDITERKEAEQRMSLMIHELNHRVKNTLAVVQGLARQTFAVSASLEQARDDFTARLVALAGAHDVITDQNWAGANLRDLIERAVAGQLQGGTRLVLQGPPVGVAPKTALSLALAFHELVTNALKYGALSNPAGAVTLAWSVDAAEGRLRLVWTEAGGPPVAAPVRRGFGSRLLERALAADLGGKVVLRYEPEGLVCEIEAPLAAAG